MRPNFDTFTAPTLPAPAVSQQKAFEEGSKALGGSNHDIVANRFAIRMANMSAVEVLEAELASLKPLKPKASPSKPAILTTSTVVPASNPSVPPAQIVPEPSSTDDGVSGLDVDEEPAVIPTGHLESQVSEAALIEQSPIQTDESTTIAPDTAIAPPSSIGVKRKIDELGTNGANTPVDEEKPSEAATIKKRIVHADGTVETEDTVKLVVPWL
jgi:5'-3' exoribonuclease 2